MARNKEYNIDDNMANSNAPPPSFHNHSHFLAFLDILLAHPPFSSHPTRHDLPYPTNRSPAPVVPQQDGTTHTRRSSRRPAPDAIRSVLIQHPRRLPIPIAIQFHYIPGRPGFWEYRHPDWDPSLPDDQQQQSRPALRLHRDGRPARPYPGQTPFQRRPIKTPENHRDRSGGASYARMQHAAEQYYRDWWLATHPSEREDDQKGSSDESSRDSEGPGSSTNDNKTRKQKRPRKYLIRRSVLRRDLACRARPPSLDNVAMPNISKAHPAWQRISEGLEGRRLLLEFHEKGLLYVSGPPISISGPRLLLALTRSPTDPNSGSYVPIRPDHVRVPTFLSNEAKDSASEAEIQALPSSSTAAAQPSTSTAPPPPAAADTTRVPHAQASHQPQEQAEQTSTSPETGDTDQRQEEFVDIPLGHPDSPPLGREPWTDEMASEYHPQGARNTADYAGPLRGLWGRR